MAPANRNLASHEPVNDGLDDLSIEFSRMLRQLDEDGRVARSSLQSLRRAIHRTAPDVRSQLFFNPEKHLGQFDSLPDAAKVAIVDSIHRCDLWRIRGFEFGPLYSGILRILWRAKHVTYRRTTTNSHFSRLARGMIDSVAYGARKAPFFIREVLLRQWRSYKALISKRVNLLDAIALANLNPAELGNSYARNIPQTPAYRGYWHEPNRDYTVGRVLGLDLLPTDNGLWFIESNTHPGLPAIRSAMYKRDPMCANILRFARLRGYERVVLLDNSSSGIDPRMAQSYTEEAARAGIGLILPTLPNVPEKTTLRSYGIPDIDLDRTLVVRIRPYPHAMDHLLGSKRATFRALNLYLKENAAPGLNLPLTTRMPCFSDFDPECLFPNLVYKLPEIEEGRGVFFIKAASPERAGRIVSDALKSPKLKSLDQRILYAVTSKQGVFQPFLKSRILDDGRLYKIRAEVMLTPVGVQFLSALRMVAPEPIPDRLEEGLVENTRPFLINAANGATLQLLPKEEEKNVAQTAETIARGLAWAIERSFQVRPSSLAEPDTGIRAA